MSAIASVEKPRRAAKTDEHRENAASSTRLITLDQVQERVPFERTWFHRNIRRGRFPRPIRPGGNRLLFVEREVEQWIADQRERRKK